MSVRKRKLVEVAAEEQSGFIEADELGRRDRLLATAIVRWLPEWLPPGLADDCSGFDIHASLHSDNVSIVELGRIQYSQPARSKRKKKTELSAVDAFLELSDDDDEEEELSDDEASSEPSTTKVRPTRIESFRMVLDFSADLDDSFQSKQKNKRRKKNSLEEDTMSEPPRCLAVYELKNGGEWVMIHEITNSPMIDQEIRVLCESKGDLNGMDNDDEDDDEDDCLLSDDDSSEGDIIQGVDLESILKAYPTRELIKVMNERLIHLCQSTSLLKNQKNESDKSLMPKWMHRYRLNTDKGRSELLSDLRKHDRDMLELLFAQLAYFDSELVEILTKSDDSLIEQTKQLDCKVDKCLRFMDTAQESGLLVSIMDVINERVLKLMYQMCTRMSTLIHRKKATKKKKDSGVDGSCSKYSLLYIDGCLRLMIRLNDLLFGFIVDCYLEDNGETEGKPDDYLGRAQEQFTISELMRNGRLNYQIQMIEVEWQKVIDECLRIREENSEVNSRLSVIKEELLRWQGLMTPILGPLFSDNLSSLMSI